MRFVLFLLCLLVCPVLGEPNFELSYLLVRTSDGKIIEQREADQPRIPASTLKTVTAALSLEALGPDHVFQTTVRAEAPLYRRHLRGDLSLKGSADPELTHRDLESLADQLVERGVKVVEGDLVVDAGPYAFPPYGPGWAWDDAGLSYSPEITGLNVDGGVVTLDTNHPPLWAMRREGSESATFLIPGQEGVQVWGELPESVSPPRVVLRTGERFKAILSERGIRIEGEVRAGVARGAELAAHQSRPLTEILKKALAESDNLAMELLYRASGKALPECLREERLRVVDGSGLSRYNLLSCRHLVLLLRSSDLRSVLPSAGVGTLSERFREGWAARQVRAKTGSMSNVSAIAGYLFAGTDKECVFAIMINGHLGSYSERKALEDQLVERWAREIGWPYSLSDS